MKRTGQKVYNKRKWRRVRKAYMESHHWICERCGNPASICHHKTYLTAGNVDNPDVAYNSANLECLCQACHNLEHDHFQQTGAVFSSSGDVVRLRETKAAQEFKTACDAIATMNFNPPT